MAKKIFKHNSNFHSKMPVWLKPSFFLTGFIFIVLFSLLIGNSIHSQTFELRKGMLMKETPKLQEKLEQKEIIPEFEFIKPGERVEIKGEIKIVKIEGKVKDANAVEFYYQSPGATLPVYLGKARSKGENFWEYSWNTNLTPNGDYEIFAKIINQYGEYESSRIKVKIENEVPRDEKKQEELKEKIEVTKQEIEKEEKEMEEKKEEVKEKVVGEIKRATEETKKLLTEEKKKIVEPEIEKKLKGAEEEIKQNLEKFIEITKEEKKLEKDLEQKKGEKKETETKIQSTQEELVKIQKVKEKLSEGSKKEQAKVVEEIKKEILESQQRKKEESEKELVSLTKKTEEVKKEKEEVKTEIKKAVEEITKPVEKILSPSEKPKISEMKKSTQEKAFIYLENLEQNIKEKEEVKIEKSQILLKDSDGDGLSDDEEIRLGLAPFNPDSDNDGFLDGVEIKTGYDPLKPGPADKIIYQDPQKVLPKKSDVYRVEKIEKVTLPSNEMGLKFSGKGLPNSFVTLYIFSTPVVLVVKTDSNGNWEYTLDKPLTDGEHRVYVALTNNQGQIEARSETFVFVKIGEKIFRIFEAPAAEATSPVQALKKPFIILIIAIIILTLGIALIIISILTKRKIEKIKNT